MKLNISYIEDQKTGGYTAIAFELPELIAQGNSIDDAEANLFRLIAVVYHDESKDENDNHPLGKITHRHYNIEPLNS